MAALSNTFFHIEETVLYGKRMPSGTFTARVKSVPGSKLPRTGSPNAAGDLKLKPVPIYSAKNPRALNYAVYSPSPHYLRGMPVFLEGGTVGECMGGLPWKEG